MAASLPHQFYSDYSNFYAELFGLPIPAACADACSSEETSHMFNNNYAAMMNIVPSMSTTCDQLNSPVSAASFPEQFGVSDCMAVPTLPEHDTGFAACKDYCGGSELKSSPAYNSVASDNWGVKDTPETKVEETEVKVGRYSVEEKKHRILRYLQKRSQRNFNKTIKYACRRTLADKRVRIRGRFAKNNEPGEDEMAIKMYADSYEQINYSLEDAFKIKYDEDDMLQAAIANFVHFPYLAS